MAITMNDAGKFPILIAKMMLSYLCLWPLHTSKILKFFRWLTLGNMLLLLSSQIMFMIKNITNLEIMGSSCTTVSSSTQTTAKIFLITYYYDDLADILKIISNEYWPADLAGPEIEHSILISSRIIIGMWFVYLTSAFLSCWEFMGIHLVFGRRQLPEDVSLPFRWNVTPVYEILYVWQFFTNMYSVIHTIANHDFFLNALITCSISQIKLLKAVLRTIGTGKNTEINQKLVKFTETRRRYYYLQSDEEMEFLLVTKCVEHHNKIITICDRLEHIYGKMILLQFFLSSIALCVSSFILTNFDKYLTKMLTFSTAHLIQLLVLCATGNELIHESESIADAAYDCGWYNKSYFHTRKGLILIMQRAQRPQKISAMGFANLDFPNFLNVLRLSFSFYTLLSSMQQGNH